MRGSERFTQRASTAITKAHDAALGMGHSYVGTEHLLLGIIREGEGLGARILTDNALMQCVIQMKQFLAFAFHQFGNRNACPAGDNAGNFFFRNLIPKQCCLLSTAFFFQVCQLLLQLGKFAIF